MYIGFYNYYKVYNNNKMLTDPGSPTSDNCVYPFFLLAQKLRGAGHKIATIDSDDLEKFDAIVFVEFPGFNNKYFKKLIANGFKNLYLILLESPIIKPDNYDTQNHTYFKKIFTWSDELIKNPPSHKASAVGTTKSAFGQAKSAWQRKYFKIQYSHKIPTEFNFNLEQKSKLCAIISSNKSTVYPTELYSERIKAIRWFEQNHPKDFDLYGKGWDRHNFQGFLWRVNIARLNRLTFLTKLLAPYYPSYKGSVASKKEILEKYKFSICYENVKDVQGYITEKIMDCFLAGCVPVYLGAQNITDHIPQNTFIDKRKFATYDQLYSYIKNMPDNEYLGYLDAIKNFLKSQKSYPFSAEYFTNTIIDLLIKDFPITM